MPHEPIAGTTWLRIADAHPPRGNDRPALRGRAAVLERVPLGRQSGGSICPVEKSGFERIVERRFAEDAISAPVLSAHVTSIQPELWVERAGEAVEFYEAAFGAVVLHRVGDGDDIVAQLAVEDAVFWVTAASPDDGRHSPAAINGATGRTLLVVEDPDAVFGQALDAGARQTAAVAEEHGWQLGRLIDPFGHEWEIGRPLGEWPPR